MFDSPFAESILKRAREKKLIDLYFHDLRAYTLDKHKNVDDYPFGGGAGMVMNVEPIDRALTAIKENRPQAHSILLTPSGKLFTQSKARELSLKKEIILICGRYEGVDERVRLLVEEEISVGDYVLSGGEIPAMTIVDAVSRLVPGVLGDEESLNEESFSAGLLEYPQYTRPQNYKGWQVPDVLLSGNHKEIENWRREESLKKTATNRPDLLKKYLSD